MYNFIMSISYKQRRYELRKTNAIKKYTITIFGRNVDKKLKGFLDLSDMPLSTKTWAVPIKV